MIANDPEGVCCLVIDREAFKQLISDIEEIRTKYVDESTARRKYVHSFIFFTE